MDCPNGWKRPAKIDVEAGSVGKSLEEAGNERKRRVDGKLMR